MTSFCEKILPGRYISILHPLLKHFSKTHPDGGGGIGISRVTKILS